MRVILIPSVMLLCAAPIFAQGTPAEVQINNPAPLMSRQQTRQPPSPFGKPAPTGVDVPPETPVATLDGVCDQPRTAATKICKTVITRAQIDSLMDMLSPGASPAARRTFALSYARMVAASSAAEKQHLEKDPAVAAELQAQLKLTRMRVLSNRFYRHLDEHSADVSASEIQKYYMEHKDNFDEGQVRRLAIPRPALSKSVEPLDPVAVKANIDELVARAAKGEDFDQVQREAYIMFGIATPPPPTKVLTLRRSNLRPEEAKVFDLNVGEVTQMVNAPDAYVILKLESKQPVPLEVAEPEIKPILQREQKSQELRNAAKNVAADFNLAYLGLPSAPELFVPPDSAQPPELAGAPSPLRPRAPNRPRMPMGAQVPRGFPPARQ